MSERVFLAVSLPEAVREEAARVQQVMRWGAAKPRLVSPELMHITLIFFGEIGRAELSKIIEGLGKLVFPSFEGKLSGLGAFPSWNRPRVLWLGAESTAFDGLVRAVHGALKMPLPQKFSPHITLARLRGFEKGLLRLNEGLRVKPISFRVDRIVLMASRLTPSGPIYQPLHEFLLRD